MAMATSFAATASPASVAKNINKPTSHSPLCYLHSPNHSHSKLSFRLFLKPRLRFFSKYLQSSWNRTPVIRERLDEVSVDGQSNASATSISKSDVLVVEAKNSKSLNEHSSADLSSEESISELFYQVANLVKLVDSRDIVELQLKQLDCELLIRKKLTLPQQQPSAPAPVVMMQSPPQAAAPPAFQVFAPAAAPTPSAPASSQAPSPAPSSSASKSFLPPLRCPMAGMFYRSSAPGEPPFVKVGDKVQKGQVLCIIEAMKLMNEIENQRRQKQKAKPQNSETKPEVRNQTRNQNQRTALTLLVEDLRSREVFIWLVKDRRSLSSPNSLAACLTFAEQ